MKRFYEDLHTGATVTLSRFKGGYWVDKVFCPHDQRGKGAATRVMRRVLADADAKGITLKLVIAEDGDGGPDNVQLERWYNKLGFVVDATITYVRKPHAAPLFASFPNRTDRTRPLQLGSVHQMQEARAEEA